jgi:hypothetical protein
VAYGACCTDCPLRQDQPVGIDGLVELEFLLRGHARDRLCDDGFGERGDVVERLIVRRNARALLAGSFRPDELAVHDIGDGDTRHVVLLEPFGKVLDDLRPEVSGCRLGLWASSGAQSVKPAVKPKMTRQSLRRVCMAPLSKKRGGARSLGKVRGL